MMHLLWLTAAVVCIVSIDQVQIKCNKLRLAGENGTHVTVHANQQKKKKPCAFFFFCCICHMEKLKKTKRANRKQTRQTENRQEPLISNNSFTKSKCRVVNTCKVSLELMSLEQLKAGGFRLNINIIRSTVFVCKYWMHKYTHWNQQIKLPIEIIVDIFPLVQWSFIMPQYVAGFIF